MSKRPLQASIAPDFLFKGRIDVHDTKSFLLAFIAPDFSENFLNKLETFSMRARHITGLAHNVLNPRTVSSDTKPSLLIPDGHINRPLSTHEHHINMLTPLLIFLSNNIFSISYA